MAIGLLVGAGIALLLAQQTGSDTRRALHRRLKRAGLRGRNAWDDLRFELRQARRAIRQARRGGQLDVEELVET